MHHGFVTMMLPWTSETLEFGRDGGIRTHDPLTPSQVRYQAALHPELAELLMN
jgi:hypothetical protein